MSGSHIDLCVDYDATRIQASIQWTEPVLALFGPSGSGKSTLLEAVAAAAQVPRLTPDTDLSYPEPHENDLDGVL